MPMVRRSIEEIHRVEIELWKEIRQQDWLDNLSNKMSEFRWLRPRLSLYERKFRDARSVLELGGGEGWASCLVKHLYPGVSIAASDISEFAISGIDKWEKLFESKVDTWFSCKSYEVPLPENSLDLIFTFQAAHHFVLQMETIREVARLLRPGGTCMYLNEPSCRRYLHPVAKWRVNRKRPECPEDVLVIEDMREAAATQGFRLNVNYSTQTVNRGVVEGVYYQALSMAPYLCRWLPCTADFIFTKE
jgi:ubiquinone/menaquinone biosynthesis C-methylase UbiE